MKQYRAKAKGFAGGRIIYPGEIVPPFEGPPSAWMVEVEGQSAVLPQPPVVEEPEMKEPDAEAPVVKKGRGRGKGKSSAATDQQPSEGAQD